MTTKYQTINRRAMLMMAQAMLDVMTVTEGQELLLSEDETKLFNERIFLANEHIQKLRGEIANLRDRAEAKPEVYSYFMVIEDYNFVPRHYTANQSGMILNMEVFYNAAEVIGVTQDGTRAILLKSRISRPGLVFRLDEKVCPCMGSGWFDNSSPDEDEHIITCPFHG